MEIARSLWEGWSDERTELRQELGLVSPQPQRGRLKCNSGVASTGLCVDFLAFDGRVMHEAADQWLLDSSALQALSIGVSVPVRRRAECLSDVEAYAFARGCVSLVVLGERIHRAERLALNVDEGERMRPFKTRDLFEIAVP